MAHDLTAGGTQPGDRYAEAIHALVRERWFNRSFSLSWAYSRPAADHVGNRHLSVHPADNESFGRIVVEAMAAGLPVVGVRGGGVGEIVVDGETGLLARRITRRRWRSAFRNWSATTRCGIGSAAGRPLRRDALFARKLRRWRARVYEESMLQPLGEHRGAERP